MQEEKFVAREAIRFKFLNEQFVLKKQVNKIEVAKVDVRKYMLQKTVAGGERFFYHSLPFIFIMFNLFIP